ncbi:hypothetical protein AALC75_22540 [Lachnospiraceae bacterium 48-42]
MINFEVYLGFLLTLVVCYISNSKVKTVRIWVPILAIVVNILYFLYDIKHFFIADVFPALMNCINGFCSFILFLGKFFPFKKGYLSDKNFKISYITESVIMVIVFLIFIILFIGTTIECWNNYIVFKIIPIAISIWFSWGLIWFNDFLSNFLCSSISNHFGIISLFFNIVTYIIISILLAIFSAIMYNIFDDINQKRVAIESSKKQKLDISAPEKNLKEPLLKNFLGEKK